MNVWTGPLCEMQTIGWDTYRAQHDVIADACARSQLHCARGVELHHRRGWQLLCEELGGFLLFHWRFSRRMGLNISLVFGNANASICVPEIWVFHWGHVFVHRLSGLVAHNRNGHV